MSDMTTVTSISSVSPMLLPSLRILSANPVGRSRESCSPCSSLTAIARCNVLRRLIAALLPADTPSARRTQSFSMRRSISSAVVCMVTAIAFMGVP